MYRRIKPLNIQYLIADKRFDQFSRYQQLQLHVDDYDLLINTIWENKNYKIFKVQVPSINTPLIAKVDHP